MSVAPSLFEIDEDEGVLRVLVTHVDDAQVEAARDAAGDCPTGAITLVETA